MVLVEHDFCPRVERRCIRTELNKPNRITLCHAFEKGSTRCVEPRHRLSFCIDKYEYPNKPGEHPSWMVSWYDAEATCRSLGKRTCWDWEWVAACEGPEETPLPYGWDRDNTKCNIDNLWIDPRLSAAHSRDPNVANKELSRLDQSVPSGAMPGCVSGYGVHDLTGNLDEWVTRAERKDQEKSGWAGLKGGAWGHVRNACRPMTTSHPPEFEYYFIGFRCCKDLAGSAGFVPPGSSPPPEVKPEDRAPVPRPIDPPGPSQQKVRPENKGT
jgi:formylglycine-generating enzyme required for sulfatase activity